jgi:hypothetical protein
MYATIPPERHNPKAWANYGCKGTIKFADLQILRGKSFRSYKSFKGDLGFREKKKPFMRIFA